MSSDALWVIGAAFVNFVLGAIWYSVFGKQWLHAWKLQHKDIRPGDPKPYLLAFIGSLYASYGLFLMLKHIQPQNLVEQLTVGLGCWLFIQVGLGAKHYAFARVSGKAFAIDYGLDLVGIVLMTFMVY
ncbi:MAG: DUF1761 domain-containing protein [Bacteriovoracaceae bacterium]|nr:DUF1761 domain-containing protein [Bacteriovoracaceae bacterium]